MRLDHIAYRVKDRVKTVKFITEALGYRVGTEFDINFDDGSMAKCFALEPPEKSSASIIPWAWSALIETDAPKLHAKVLPDTTSIHCQNYHMPPEIFVSDGTPDSIVGRWVAERGDIGGIHHLAYQVESVAETMKEWRKKGYAEFTTEEPLTCPDLTQCFTKPSELCGVIFEFIERKEGCKGFCEANVKNLMESTVVFSQKSSTTSTESK